MGIGLLTALTGRNNLAGNAVAVVFAVFKYLPTLVEVLVARIFLDQGMRRAPCWPT